MSAWPSRTVSDPPVFLAHWGAFEVLIPRLSRSTFHVAGAVAGIGHVSSPVEESSLLQGVPLITGHERTYRLSGPPGMVEDAVRAWQQWLRLWSAAVLRDITQQVHCSSSASEVGHDDAG